MYSPHRSSDHIVPRQMCFDVPRLEGHPISTTSVFQNGKMWTWKRSGNLWLIYLIKGCFVDGLKANKPDKPKMDGSVMRLLSTRGRQRSMTIDALLNPVAMCFLVYFVLSVALWILIGLFTTPGESFSSFYHVCASFTVISTDLFLRNTLGVFRESDTDMLLR